jgi:predicted NBD/HSP70 family sugar kinase
MDHFAGLDVAVKETSVCIVDDTGRIIREVKVASEPEALLQVLKNRAYHFKRIFPALNLFFGMTGSFPSSFSHNA